MKKFMKISSLIAMILIIVGLGLAIVGVSIKGIANVDNLVSKVTDGKVRIDLSDAETFGMGIGDSIWKEICKNIDYDMDSSVNFNGNHEIHTGDVEKYSLGNSIHSVNIMVGGCAFQIEESEDENFYLKAESTRKLQGYTENEILYIKGAVSTRSIGNLSNAAITLYVPKDFIFDKVEMEGGAGLMELGDLRANDISLEVGAGQIVLDSVNGDNFSVIIGMGEIWIQGMQVRNLDAEVDMGHMYAEGDISENANVECAMGSVEMKIAGTWEDFDYDLECGMGNMEVGDNAYSGLGAERQINNGAQKKMNVECAMGDVEIKFMEN